MLSRTPLLLSFRADSHTALRWRQLAFFRSMEPGTETLHVVEGARAAWHPLVCLNKLDRSPRMLPPVTFLSTGFLETCYKKRQEYE